MFGDTEVSFASSSSGYEGQLREEVTVQSNPIIALERREDRLTDPVEGKEPVINCVYGVVFVGFMDGVNNALFWDFAAPQSQKEEVCVSIWGFIISLIITALLAIVAVAVAVSCWLMAYRRRPKSEGPLPHPPEFPNPLFTTPEPLTEPSPDYLS